MEALDVHQNGKSDHNIQENKTTESARMRREDLNIHHPIFPQDLFLRTSWFLIKNNINGLSESLN